MRLDLEPNAPAFPPVATNAAEPDSLAKFTEYLQAGVKAAQSGDRKAARSHLMSAVDIDPHSENAWLWLASISEYPEELLVFLNNVLDINPDNERALQWSASTKTLLSKTLVQRGVDASEEGRVEFAMQCFDQALSYDERNVTAWLWLASLSDSESRKMEYLRHVLMIEPENVAAKSAIETVEADTRTMLLASAAKAAVTGDMRNALTMLDKVESRWPENKEVWIMRSHVAVVFDDKIASLSRILELDADDQYAQMSLASLRSIIDAAGPSPVVAEERSEHLENVAAEEVSEVEQMSEPEFEARPDLAAVAEAAIFDHADDSTIPTHELPPLESIVPPGTFAEAAPVVEVKGVEEDHIVSTPVVEATAEPVQEEWNSPWKSHADSNSEINEFDDPTVDAITFHSDEPEMPQHEEVHAVHDEHVAVDEHLVVEDHHVVEDHPVESFESPVIELDSFDHSYEVPTPVDSFENAVEPVMPELEPVHDPEPVAFESEPAVMDDRVKILLVDDSATARKLIAGKLEQSGFLVLSAENGTEAIDLARSSSPALALIDIAMPVMDGYAVCHALRHEAITQNVPVVMISGKDGYYEEDRGSAAGASGFITKPFGPETLMKTVQGFLAGAAPNK
jgi:CheY-like chemotaxis protein